MFERAARLFRRLIGGRLSEEEKSLVKQLRAAGVKRFEVSDRGVVMCDPEEVATSDKFRELCRLAREVIER